MSKHNYRRSFSIMLVFGVLGMASGCDRAGDIVRSVDRARLARMEDAPDKPESTVAVVRDAAHSTVAEARHFEVYNRMRNLFDDPAADITAHAHESSHEIRPATGFFNAIRPGSFSAGCFMATEFSGD